MAGKSVSLQRHVQAYLSPKLHPIFVGYCAIEEIGKSELINEALTQYFKNMPYDKLSKCRLVAVQLEDSKNKCSQAAATDYRGEAGR